MTKSGGFSPEMTDYVVAKRTGVTDGYGQGSAVSKNLTRLQPAVLLGLSVALFF
jgi:hypothetical protein